MLDHKSQVERSIRRKIGHLVELATSLLEVRLDRLNRSTHQIDAEKHASARGALREVDDRIADVAAVLTRPLEDGIPEIVQRSLSETAMEVVNLKQNGIEGNGALKRRTAAALADEAEKVRVRMEELRWFLTDTASRLSESLGVSLALEQEGSEGTFDPLPPLDEGRLGRLTVESCSRILAAWPGFARRRVGRRLQIEFASELWSLARDYREKLRRWTEQNLRRATNAFEARIAIVRANVDATHGNEDAGKKPPSFDLILNRCGLFGRECPHQAMARPTSLEPRAHADSFTATIGRSFESRHASFL